MHCLVGSARACVVRASSPSVARIAAIPTSATPFAGLGSSLTATTFLSSVWSASPRWHWFFLHDRGASPRDRCFSRKGARHVRERSQGMARSRTTVGLPSPRSTKSARFVAPSSCAPRRLALCCSPALRGGTPCPGPSAADVPLRQHVQPNALRSDGHGDAHVLRHSARQGSRLARCRLRCTSASSAQRSGPSRTSCPVHQPKPCGGHSILRSARGRPSLRLEHQHGEPCRGLAGRPRLLVFPQRRSTAHPQVRDPQAVKHAVMPQANASHQPVCKRPASAAPG